MASSAMSTLTSAAGVYEPQTVKEALACADADLWQQAMDDELRSLLCGNEAIIHTELLQHRYMSVSTVYLWK
jgi:hypothetical protein